MTAWRRRLPLALFICPLLALPAVYAATGTPSSGRASTAQPSTPPSTSPSTGFTDPTPRIAIVYDAGGRESGGLNELAWQGAKRAADRLGAELKEVTAGPDDTDADREARLEELAAARYYPIFPIGSTYAGPLANVAPKYRGIWFGIVDDGSVDASNVIGIQFKEEQGSFLVGAAAALTSKTGKIGFIAAVQSPLREKYEAGFAAGARAADQDVEIRVAYLSRPPASAGSSDPSKVRKAALEMFDAGVDVLFGADLEVGEEVIRAAHDRGLWAVGVETDQYLSSDPSVRGAILTSMLKRADTATYTIANEIAFGVPKDGRNVFGIGMGGVGYSTSGGFVDPIKTQLDAFAATIASGEIRVPTKP